MNFCIISLRELIDLGLKKYLDKNQFSTKNICREQMNFGTAYLDGSGVYGATPESADKLREFDGGFLKVSCNKNIIFYALST